jgi:L-fuculose-phosphate aldolase
MENCDICANDVFRSSWGNTGVTRKAFDAPPPMGADPQPAAAAHATASAAAVPPAIDYDVLVKAVTEQVCRELGIGAA